MATRKVEYKITADTKQAEQGFQKLEGLAKRIREQFVTTAGRYVGFASVVALTTKSIQAYMDAETRNLKLQQTLINTRNYSITTYEELIKYSEQLQRNLGIEDDRIIELIQTLIGFQTPIALVKDLSMAVIELSTFLGIDLQSAAILVGRTIEGSVNPLKRYGIELKNVSTETERAYEVTRQIMEKWGGLTQATMNSARGDWARFRADYNSLIESIGKGISWLYSRVIDVFTSSSVEEMRRKRFKDVYAEMERSRLAAISEAYQNAFKTAKQLSEVEIKERIKAYDRLIEETKKKGNELVKVEVRTSREKINALELDNKKAIRQYVENYEEQRRISNQVQQLNQQDNKLIIQIYEEEKRAYEDALELKKKLLREEFEKLERLRQEAHQKEIQRISEIIDKTKQLIELTELQIRMGLEPGVDLRSFIQTKRQELEIEYQKSQILENKLNLLKAIDELQTRQVYYDRLQITEMEKRVGNLLERIPKELKEVELIDVELAKEETDEFTEAFSSSMYSTIWFIGSEFEKMWQKAFGEANSLLEVFTMNFSRSIVEIMAKLAATAILTQLGIPLPSFHSGGIVKKAHSGMLASDEVPVIARKGEMILTPQQQWNLFNSLNRGEVRSNSNINLYLMVDGEMLFKKTIKPRMNKLLSENNYIIA